MKDIEKKVWKFQQSVLERVETCSILTGAAASGCPLRVDGEMFSDLKVLGLETLATSMLLVKGHRLCYNL